MKTCFFSVVIFFVILTPSLRAYEINNPGERLEAVNQYLKEETFVVSLEELIFDQEEISINWNGNTYPISSLKKEGNQWLAKTIPYGYCPRGHPRCNKCNLCHLKGCWYYVPPCWQ